MSSLSELLPVTTCVDIWVSRRSHRPEEDPYIPERQFHICGILQHDRTSEITLPLEGLW